jgi:uncharacterized RDD family membrane protein YckC
MAERLAAPGIAAGDIEASTGDADDADHAGAGARIIAYLIDSIILFCFSIVFLVAASLVLFIDSDEGRDEITNGESWAVIGLLLANLPAWVLFSVLLTHKRGQTVGQYVMGLGIGSEDGSRPALGKLTTFWLALHPLVFHPIMAAVWLFLVWVLLAKTTNEFAVIVAGSMALLCFVAPLAALVFMLGDPQRRTIHDRLSGLRVQRLQ